MKLNLCETGTEKDIEKYHLKWIFAEKIDGCRCLAFCLNGEVKLIGRSGTDYTKKFREVADELKSLNGIFDGEIVCDTFEHTESRVHTENPLKLKLLEKEYPAVFHIFDLIIPEKTLLERLQAIKTIDFSQFKHISLLPYTFDGIGLWNKMKDENKEGVIIKNPESRYEGRRTFNWLKVKNIKSKDILVKSYEVNPAGIRCEGEGFAVQISGSQSESVKRKIDETGSCLIEVNYLNETDNGMLRQIVFKCQK